MTLYHITLYHIISSRTVQFMFPSFLPFIFLDKNWKYLTIDFNYHYYSYSYSNCNTPGSLRERYPMGVGFVGPNDVGELIVLQEIVNCCRAKTKIANWQHRNLHEKKRRKYERRFNSHSKKSFLHTDISLNKLLDRRFKGKWTTIFWNHSSYKTVQSFS